MLDRANDRSEKDQGEKDKPVAIVECADAAVREAAKDVIASGEVTAKSFETTLLHRPAGLKAKRLLLVGGGKARNFSAAELRKLAGAAVRTLKSKSIRSFAFALPENGIAAGVSASLCKEAVRAIVEGAFVGNFEPGYYKSDRKDKDNDQKIDAVTIVVPSRRYRSPGKLPAGCAHRRRVAELHPRPGQRTLQPHDPNHSGRARQEDGRRSRPEMRSPTTATKSDS